MSRGLRHLDACAAEAAVQRHYASLGAQPVAARLRLGRTDIDLVLQHNQTFIFVEVKKSKTHDQAVTRITAAQTARLFEAVALFMTDRTGEIRVDVALVDQAGRVMVLENAFA